MLFTTNFDCGSAHGWPCDQSYFTGPVATTTLTSCANSVRLKLDHDDEKCDDGVENPENRGSVDIEKSRCGESREVVFDHVDELGEVVAIVAERVFVQAVRHR
jgi:hypothetical protein